MCTGAFHEQRIKNIETSWHIAYFDIHHGSKSFKKHKSWTSFNSSLFNFCVPGWSFSSACRSAESGILSTNSWDPPRDFMVKVDGHRHNVRQLEPAAFQGRKRNLCRNLQEEAYHWQLEQATSRAVSCRWKLNHWPGHLALNELNLQSGVRKYKALQRFSAQANS